MRKLFSIRARAVIAAGFVALFSAGVVVEIAAAHGGGLDASGCHNDRKRGGYHCH